MVYNVSSAVDQQASFVEPYTGLTGVSVRDGTHAGRETPTSQSENSQQGNIAATVETVPDLVTEITACSSTTAVAAQLIGITSVARTEAKGASCLSDIATETSTGTGEWKLDAKKQCTRKSSGL